MHPISLAALDPMAGFYSFLFALPLGPRLFRILPYLYLLPLYILNIVPAVLHLSDR